MIVVDTNVLVYLLLPCPKTDLAELLWTQQPQWAAPPLWRSEFRNGLTGYLRRGLLQPSRAVALMWEAEETLSAHEEMVASERVLQLESISNCSSYDCEITEDRAILKAFPAIAKPLHQATS